MTGGARLSAGVCFALMLLVVGYIGAAQPLVYAGLGGALAISTLAALAYRWPERALACTPLLVLVAGTRFRVRDPLAAVSGVVDAAVLVELSIYAVIALILLMAFISREFTPSRLSVLERLFAGFAAVAVCSVVWSIAPMLTLVRGVQVAILVALALVLVRIMDPQRFLRYASASLLLYVLVAAAISVAFPWARLQDEFAPLMEGGRFAFFAMHPIESGSVTALALLFVVTELLYSPRPMRMRRFVLPLWLYVAPLGAILVATNSRGPLLGFLAAAGALIALRILRLWAALLLSAVLLVGVIASSNTGASVGGVLRDAAYSRNPAAVLLMRGQDAQEFEHMTGRVGLWKGLLPTLEKQPFLGYGYQASRPLVLRVAPWAGDAHNAMLQTLLDLGAVGAALLWLPFFTMLALAIKHASELRVLRTWPLSAVLGVGIFQLVDSLSDVSLAGAPGIALAIVAVCMIVADRQWLQSRRMAAGVDSSWTGRDVNFERPGWSYERHLPTARG
jgi:O-antigen ligase